jgi:glutathione-regulated potassium-efflux system protein KefB
VSLYVRSYDRPHTLELIAKGVDFELRETYESAMVFGRHALETLGLDAERARAVEEDVRKRDLARLALQQAEGIFAGIELIAGRGVEPTPLRAPEHEATPLNAEADDIIHHETEFSS